MANGVFIAQKKDGSIYYRSSITYKNKHISLGSFISHETANEAYEAAKHILAEASDLNDSTAMLTTLFSKYSGIISFDKIVSLVNFRDNGVYFSNPIYLKKKFFHYYITPEYVLIFDVEDLFYYAGHRIQKRGNRLFVADYGMQTTLKSRYGIKPYAVEGRDYYFINGDNCDFRYENIKIKSKYTGVLPIYEQHSETVLKYKVSVHVRGNLTVGLFNNEETAAIAYNKAVDLLKKHGGTKNYGQNYIEDLCAEKYADMYFKIDLSSFESKIIKHKSIYNDNQQS